MKDRDKTKDQLISELDALRQKVAEGAEAKQAEEALNQTVQRLNVMVDIASATASTLDLDVLLNQLLRRIIEITPAGIGVIQLYDPEVDVLMPRACLGIDDEAFRGIRLQPGESISGKVFQTGRSILSRTLEEAEVLRDLRPENARLFALARGDLNIQSNICVPLHTPTGETLGTLSLDSVDTLFGADDLRLVEGVAAQAALAIKNAQTYEALEESEGKFQDLYDNAPDMFISVDSATAKILQCNQTLAIATGYTKEEIIGRPVFDMYHPDCMEDVKRAFQSFVQTGEMHDAELQLKRKDGSKIEVSINVSAVRDETGEILYSRSIWRDITERKQAELALRESEEKHRTLFETMTQGVVYQDADGSIKSANPISERILGLNLDQMAGKTSIDPRWRSLHEDGTDFPGETHPSMVALKTGEKVNNVIMGVFNPQREAYTWLNINAVPQFRTGEDAPFQVYTTFEDITERKQAEESLREESRLRAALLDNIPRCIALILKKGTREIVASNKFAREIGAVPGLTCFETCAMRSDSCSFCLAPELWKTGQSQTLEVEYRGTWYEGIWEPLSEDLFVHYIFDITERKHMEQELIRTQRLHVLGEMSAGVSHNLNNILSSVLGPAQLLLRSTSDPGVRKDAELIIAGARRAADLVHRLHLSTRGVEEDKLQPVQVNQVIEQAVQVIRPRWKDEPESRGVTVEVVTTLGEVPAIKSTETRLHDIIVNLVLNATDAMPEGGTVFIGTQAVEDKVQITVRDTGIGMDEETRSRAFEPFFTTKMDVGSGLGLSTVYGTVTQWGGDIDVESAPGEGTTFTIELPAWEEIEAQVDTGEPLQPVRRAKLLIVDDDEGVCNLLSRLFGEDHEVASALSGREALERFAPGRYDVAMIDQGMPGMPGDQVVREMSRVDPNLVTVSISGWEFDANDPRLAVYDLCIQKPFDDLEKVEDVVAQAVRLHDERVEGKG